MDGDGGLSDVKGGGSEDDEEGDTDDGGGDRRDDGGGEPETAAPGSDGGTSAAHSLESIRTVWGSTYVSITPKTSECSRGVHVAALSIQPPMTCSHHSHAPTLHDDTMGKEIDAVRK